MTNISVRLENHKFALILGHPGHELRVHRFIELYRPKVYILTDGSGSSGKSRLATTMKILNSAKARPSSFMGRYTDHEFYKIILQYDVREIDTIVDEISKDLLSSGITALAGDALEGFNPTHDVCRYMINAISNQLGKYHGSVSSNFDFALEGAPNTCPPELEDQAIWINLSRADFERKMIAAQSYSEIKHDVDEAIKVHGADIFMKECLRPVLDPKQFKNWEEELPFYESYGLKKVKTGLYQNPISFDKHVRPIAVHLQDFQ